MVKHKRKAQKKKLVKHWTEADMDDALRQLRLPGNGASLRAIPRTHRIPPCTLSRRHRQPLLPLNSFKAPHTSGPARKLSDSAEAEILRRIKEVQESGFRSGVVTNQRVAAIAAEVAVAEGTPFATAPSRDWMIAFRRRHSDVLWHGNVRSLTVVRAKVTQDALTHWTDRFAALLAEKFPRRAGVDSRATAMRIWNADETGFSSIVPMARKTWALKDAHIPQLNLVSARLTDHLTVCVTISAAGHAMPPFCISTGQRVNQEWLYDASDKTVMHVSANGSMTQALFPSFVRHFVANLPPRYSTDRPTILLMDNHNSRESSEALEYAVEHHVHIFGLLSNATHFLQPCDPSWTRTQPFCCLNDRCPSQWPQRPVPFWRPLRQWQRRRLRPSMRANAVALDKNGQLLSSGVEMTSAVYIAAVKAREAIRSEKQSKKQWAEDERTIRRAHSVQAERAAMAVSPVAEDSGDEGKENDPPPIAHAAAAAASQLPPTAVAQPRRAAKAIRDPPSWSLSYTHRDSAAQSMR